ncbi:MAG: extracellular solute-binding protein [Acetatifactor sp.]|nr:extracellular solute-binding protein [Acetatifactor sp.]
MKSSKWKKTMAAALVSVMALSATACGGSQGEDKPGTQDSGSGNGAEAKEFVYVPEFQEMNGENISYYNMKYVGDSLYYESYSYNEATGESGNDIVKYSLADGSSSTLSLDLEENVSFSEFAIASDGSLYAVCYDYSGEPGPEGYVEPKFMLCKFGTDGATVFSKDLAEVLDQDTGNTHIQNMALDSEDRVYLSVDSKIFILDAEGNPQGAVETNSNWISGMGCGRDGKVYFSYYDDTSQYGSYVLAAIDPDKKTVGETYKDFLSGNGNGLCAGTEYDFLIGDSTSVYAYDLKTQKSEKLFDWLDSDINGSYANCLGQTGDGKILAVINDWESNDNSLALLTKTKASEVAQKETIVIGAMYSDSDLQAAAVRFNKTNDKYRISIKTYLDYNSRSENMWTDALTNLNNDITSNNCPDIIDLSGLNIQQLVAKGVFEDLNPYLENSSNFSRDDFLDSVMNAYNYDGIQVSIPKNFQLQTIMGRASELGDRDGWTIDEMIAYADAHPDAQIFDYSDKSSILSLCMTFNENAFIDWSTGECKFDTPEFKSLLEFVNRFPDEWQYEDGQASTPTRIQNGEILLERSYISDFNEMQLYIEMFGGDVTCIGYPTTDGGCGTGMSASQAYAITTKSGRKDGAWEFIESFLIPEEESEENGGSSFGGWGFPNNKKQLQAMAEDAVRIEYVTDENGEILKDENGDPVVQSVGMGIGYEDGWSYDYRIPTQEEVDIILDLIDKARPISNSGGNDEILNIINEEAAAFFQGQKSVDEVTNIIQSRINIFVSENS